MRAPEGRTEGLESVDSLVGLPGSVVRTTLCVYPMWSVAGVDLRVPPRVVVGALAGSRLWCLLVVSCAGRRRALLRSRGVPASSRARAFVMQGGDRCAPAGAWGLGKTKGPEPPAKVVPSLSSLSAKTSCADDSTGRTRPQTTGQAPNARSYIQPGTNVLP
jgi:hypothetical protein